ncbi:MAG: N-acetyltransferase [Prevotellaceae bacterium]|jgi:predicted GNAT family acetyltransferase|nr:N-acetyltransferase [Prevotellaceae bacterium]
MRTDYELFDNQACQQYEFHVEGRTPRVQYIKTKAGEVYLTHTEVPFGLGGKGIGSSLVEKTLRNIRSQGLRVVPLCPFITVYINRHPEWKDFVMKAARMEGTAMLNN